MSREALGLGPAERLDSRATPPAEQRKWGEGSCQGWLAGLQPPEANTAFLAHLPGSLLAEEEAEPWASS